MLRQSLLLLAIAGLFGSASTSPLSAVVVKGKKPDAGAEGNAKTHSYSRSLDYRGRDRIEDGDNFLLNINDRLTPVTVVIPPSLSRGSGYVPDNFEDSYDARYAGNYNSLHNVIGVSPVLVDISLPPRDFDPMRAASEAMRFGFQAPLNYTVDPCHLNEYVQAEKQKMAQSEGN